MSLPTYPGRHVQQVVETGWAVRECLVALKDQSTYPGLRYFPTGACKWSSAVLQCILREEGLGHWVHRHGSDPPDGDSHAWLELDGWFLDITLDQFPGFSRAVHLEPKPHPLARGFRDGGVVETSWIKDSPTISSVLSDVRRLLSTAEAI